MENISEEVVLKLLKNNFHVATAESCTGGMIASSIVDIPGTSACFNEGYVTYSNEAKIKNLKVCETTLSNFGAVSKETASEMAVGVKNAAGSDFGVSSTGIAGPDGGTVDKPVGLVFIACAFKDEVIVEELHLTGTRTEIRQKACRSALKLLSNCIDKIEG